MSVYQSLNVNINYSTVSTSCFVFSREIRCKSLDARTLGNVTMDEGQKYLSYCWHSCWGLLSRPVNWSLNCYMSHMFVSAVGNRFVKSLTDEHEDPPPLEPRAVPDVELSRNWNHSYVTVITSSSKSDAYLSTARKCDAQMDGCV